ncbi:MAG: hypothetical protein ACM358_04980 [Gemmatimonadota bacterium]
MMPRALDTFERGVSLGLRVSWRIVRAIRSGGDRGRDRPRREGAARVRRSNATRSVAHRVKGENGSFQVNAETPSPPPILALYEDLVDELQPEPAFRDVLVGIARSVTRDQAELAQRPAVGG